MLRERAVANQPKLLHPPTDGADDTAPSVECGTDTLDDGLEPHQIVGENPG